MNILNKKFITFLSIGIFDTLLDIILFTIFIYIFGRNPFNIIFFGLISYSILILCSFLLNGKFTFNDNYLSKEKLIKYYASTYTGMIFNIIIVTFLMTTIGFGTIVSKIIAASIVLLFNYTISKRYIFEVKS